MHLDCAALTTHTVGGGGAREMAQPHKHEDRSDILYPQYQVQNQVRQHVPITPSTPEVEEGESLQLADQPALPIR